MTTSVPRQAPADPNVSARLPARDPRTLAAFLGTKGAQERLAQVAAGFMKPTDLIRLALVAASRSPKLFECSQASILRALMDAAALRIAPGGTMGRGFLVPRRNKHTRQLEASFDPGWRGLADIARRAGSVLSIEARVVYQIDRFRYLAGTEPRIEHEPYLGLEELGPIVAAYAVATLKEGPPQVEVLRKRDIERIREVSAAEAGPWVDWADEMSRKSAVRRLCKYLPYSPELEQATAMSDAVETGITTSLDLSIGDDAGEASKTLEEELADRERAAAIPSAQLGESSRTAAEALDLRDEATRRELVERGRRTVPVVREPATFVGDGPACGICKLPVGPDGQPYRMASGSIGLRHATCMVPAPPPGVDPWKLGGDAGSSDDA